MSATISELQVRTPGTLEEALHFLADHRGEVWQPLAGGTDVMVGLYRDRLGGNRWLNLSDLRPQLAGISQESGLIRLGALTTMAELRKSALLEDACPLIGRAAAAVGAVQIQNRATLGGNIVNASPAGDTLPVWLALDAELELQSARGSRRIPYDRFMTGYRHTVVESDELLTAVWFAPRTGATSRLYFRKVAPRAVQGISKLVFAAIAEMQGGRFHRVRLAFGSIGPTVVRVRAAEQLAEGKPPSPTLAGQAAELLPRDISPIDDQRSTADYRSRVAKNLLREFLAGNLGESWPPMQLRR